MGKLNVGALANQHVPENPRPAALSRLGEISICCPRWERLPIWDCFGEVAVLLLRGLQAWYEWYQYGRV